MTEQMDKNNLSRCSILVVGANGSLAKETIKTLINDGARKIVMGVRSEEKGQEARKEIMDATGVRDIQLTVVGGFDMNDPGQIEGVVNSMSGEYTFDVIFLAAGFAVFSADYQKVSWNGKSVEKNVFQNLVGSHFTYMFLRKHHMVNQGARIVLAGGEGARGIRGMIDRPSFSSPHQLRDYIYLKHVPKYNPMNAIGVSKLCGAFWVSKWSQLQQDHEIIWFSPGLTSGSSGLNHLPVMKRWFMNKVVFGIFGLMGQSQNPAVGGRKFADCLVGKVGHGGDLIGAPAGKAIGAYSDQKPLNPAFTNQALIDEFWKILEEIDDTIKLDQE